MEQFEALAEARASVPAAARSFFDGFTAGADTSGLDAGTIALAAERAEAEALAFAGDAARVVLTGLIGQQFGVDYATGFFHEFAGLVIYAFAFVCLAGVYSLIQLVQRSRGPVPSS